MQIVADENIPGLDVFFSDLGDIRRLRGRTITNKDVEKATILLVRSVTQVNQTLLENSSIKMVASATAGVDHIDRNYLAQAGIQFAHAPGCNAVAVVEYLLAAIIQVYSDKKIDWRKKTVGIIGFGQIGRRLFERLTHLGIRSLIYDPLVSIENKSKTDFTALLHKADIITLHTPLTRTGRFPTYHMIDTHQLQCMKPDALLINAARGAIINNEALASHLSSTPEFTVALDVWEGEPDINRKLFKHVHLGTPHIAGYTLESKLRGTRMIYQAVCNYLQCPAKINTTSLLPDYTLESWPFSENSSALQCAEAMVNYVYNIKADARRFNESLAAAPGTETGSVFDDYRRNYFSRREFSNLTLRKNLSTQYAIFLESLGFSQLHGRSSVDPENA